MSRRPAEDLSGLSMDDLFRLEVESQAAALTGGLLAMEGARGTPETLEEMMRAAHSLKGAARMVGNGESVRVAHAMEEIFVAAQESRCSLNARHVDVLLRGVDLIAALARDGGTAEGDDPAHAAAAHGDVDRFLADLASVDSTVTTPVPSAPVASRRSPVAANGPAPTSAPVPAPAPAAAAPAAPAAPRAASARVGGGDTAVRVTADHLNRLLGLAGESLVTARSVRGFATELQRLKRVQDDVTRSLADARELIAHTGDERATSLVQSAYGHASQSLDGLVRCLAEIETFDRRSLGVAHHLYDEVLAARMRPFADGVEGLPRLARDVARTLGKQARLEIEGESTPIDRDILQRLEAPLIHLVRNAIDHGLEGREERLRAGKSEEGVVRVQASHRMGMLIVTVADDGRGLDPNVLRRVVVERQLTTADVAAHLRDAELFEFLFLPGFSTKSGVTEISGRGVGLDVVHAMVRDVGGRLDVSSHPGNGMRIQMQLPLSLSVVRALIVAVGGEPYAIPLTRVARVVKVARGDVSSVEGHEQFVLAGRSVGLVEGRDVLGAEGAAPASEELSVVVVGSSTVQYGIVVDALLGERELVVRPLDARLGKVPTISAAAVLADGAPVLIVDVDDLIRSTELRVSGGRLAPLATRDAAAPVVVRPRILVVDDSITVRETERKLLEQAGYDVDVAVDGMDGWNAVRTGDYAMIVTDVDMPRLDGIELVKLIRRDHRLKALPIMIVSYKDREEDRLRGLDAGADYYLTKASFHDDTLLRATAQLIGEKRG